MASYTSPKHVFESHILPDMADPSKMDMSTFEDLFNVDGQSFLHDPDHPAHSASMAFSYSGPMGISAGPAMSHSPAISSFGQPQNPHMWLNPNAWLDPNANNKSGALNLDSKFDSNAFSASQVDYSFLAGENSGLLGVGESGNISSCSPSISGSQTGLSDFLFSSPSSSCSPYNFTLGDSFVEGASTSAPRHTPSYESSKARSSSVSSNNNASTKTADEPIFKAPTVPASATSHGRHRRSSPRASQSFHGTACTGDAIGTSVSADNVSLFSVQDSLNHFQLSPQLQYLDTVPLNNGNVHRQRSYPSMIQQQQHQPQYLQQHHPTSASTSPYPIGPAPGQLSHPISPATSQNSSLLMHARSRQSQSESPFYGNATIWHAQNSHSSSRRPSIHSLNSRMSHGSPRHGSVEADDEGRERTQCPYPDCGKSFKDLKAHMLTHQNERPEKCPITSCEFHKRGFARKYDRNRHLVTTHYKATIVCGFCPGSGSSAEKSFNRTDVFKRHLVSVHGVEQTPSNSKRRTPRNSARQSPNLPDDATGKCSTCGNIFASPQELFEHFDDCVLRVVTQTDPGEEANEKNLRSVVEDGDVKATLERHSLPNDTGSSSTSSASGDADDNSDYAEETIISAQAARSGKGSMAAPKSHGLGSGLHTVAEGHVMKHTNRPNHAGKVSAGLTFSKGGVALAAGKGRKKRKHYPQSWGCRMDDMKLKKRVLCVFDGQRRLWKDDMMLGDDFEVRMQLPNADDGSYVTDLDVETLKRAEAFHAATEEERGPWVPSNYSGDWNLAQQQLTA